MKELRVVRQLLRLVGEEEKEKLKLIFLSETFISLEKAKKKIDKENSVYEKLKGKANEEFKGLKMNLENALNNKK